MNATVFRALRDLAYQQAGIHLGDEKVPLVSARVGKRLTALGLPDERAYLDFLKADRTGAEMVQFLDVISTNFTSFFREPRHFEQLQRAIARWAGQGQQRFRLWCAAASSGEEPYTLAMVLDETLSASRADWRVLCTDISTKVLAMAQAGQYHGKQLAPVRKELVSRHFSRLPGVDKAGDTVYQASDALKAHLTFKRLNLAQPPFPMKGPLDVIFCRNVMIYFDTPVRQALVSAMEGLLRPGGYLMVGHAESLNGLRTGLEVIEPSTYRKPGGDE